MASIEGRRSRRVAEGGEIVNTAAMVFIFISITMAAIEGVLCLIRLCIHSNWPVTLKYQPWEYGLKIAAAIAWVAFGLLALRP